MLKHFTRTSGIVWEEMDSEVVVVDPISRTSWSLNATAAFIWKHCNGVAVADLARALGKRSGDELRAIERELLEFCSRLETAGLLTGVSAPQAGFAPAAVVGFEGLYSAPSFLTRSMAARRRPRPGGVSGPV